MPAILTIFDKLMGVVCMIQFQMFIYGVKDTYSHFIKIYENNDNFVLKNVNHFGKVVNHQN